MTESYIKMVDGVEVPMTPEEIAERQAEEALPPPPPPIAQQLDTVFDSLAPEIQADFSPLKAAVKLEIEQNHLDIAKLIIQRASVPPELEPVRTQMLSLLP